MTIPTLYEFHAYLAHASEDKAAVRRLVRALKEPERGWAIWLDEGELVAGRSLRAQLDAGLQASRFGIVVLSKDFFKKRWPREELDALFSLEQDGLTRLIPVWLDLSFDEVKAFSPILAARFSVSYAGKSVNQARRTADDLTKSMYRILRSEGGWSDIVRQEAAEGLQWVSRPHWFTKSLALVDRYVHLLWSGRGQQVPQAAGFPELESLSIGQLVERGPEFDGFLVGIVGHQENAFLLKSEQGLNEYVIILRTAEPGHNDKIAYARLGEFTQETPRIPSAKPDELAMVVGLPIARGLLKSTGSMIFNSIYLVAARVYYVPKVPQDS